MFLFLPSFLFSPHPDYFHTPTLSGMADAINSTTHMAKARSRPPHHTPNPKRQFSAGAPTGKTHKSKTHEMSKRLIRKQIVEKKTADRRSAVFSDKQHARIICGSRYCQHHEPSSRYTTGVGGRFCNQDQTTFRSTVQSSLLCEPAQKSR